MSLPVDHEARMARALLALEGLSLGEALGDRDATCAIVGGILAGDVGAEGLPAQWLQQREPLPTPISAPPPPRSP